MKKILRYSQKDGGCLEQERDVWELDKFEFPLRSNPIKNVKTINFKMCIRDRNRSVEDQILKKIECEQLHKFLLELSKEEQWLIQELYFEERTEREVACLLYTSV